MLLNVPKQIHVEASSALELNYSTNSADGSEQSTHIYLHSVNLTKNIEYIQTFTIAKA